MSKINDRKMAKDKLIIEMMVRIATAIDSVRPDGPMCSVVKTALMASQLHMLYAVRGTPASVFTLDGRIDKRRMRRFNGHKPFAKKVKLRINRDGLHVFAMRVGGSK